MQHIERSISAREPAPGGSDRAKPPPPPEVANWVITPTTPELLKQMRETFDEAEFVAALREVEKTGGVQNDGLIDEIERKIDDGV